MRAASHRRLLEGLLLLVVLIWASNYSLLKILIREVQPVAFNAVRLAVAALAFVVVWAVARGWPDLLRDDRATWSTRLPSASRDWWQLVGLGVVGHCGYQLCFINGIARTSVSNSALISGCSPIAIALLSAAAGHERIGRTHWAGALLSLFGIYLVAGRQASFGAALLGDLLILGSVACWAVYTVFSRPLLGRYSPLTVSCVTMVVGSVAFVPPAWPQMATTDWQALPWVVYAAIVGSALLALNLCYLIWYAAVQRLGSAPTSVFANIVPPAAMVIAAVVLGEPIDAAKVAGAAAVIGGVGLTRLGRRPAAPPAET